MIQIPVWTLWTGRPVCPCLALYASLEKPSCLGQTGIYPQCMPWARDSVQETHTFFSIVQPDVMGMSRGKAGEDRCLLDPSLRISHDLRGKERVRSTGQSRDLRRGIRPAVPTKGPQVWRKGGQVWTPAEGRLTHLLRKFSLQGLLLASTPSKALHFILYQKALKTVKVQSPTKLRYAADALNLHETTHHPGHGEKQANQFM